MQSRISAIGIIGACAVTSAGRSSKTSARVCTKAKRKSVCEAYALARQLVHDGSFNRRVAVSSHVPIGLIVRQDKQDVWPVRRRGRSTARRRSVLTFRFGDSLGIQEHPGCNRSLQEISAFHPPLFVAHSALSAALNSRGYSGFISPRRHNLGSVRKIVDSKAEGRLRWQGPDLPRSMSTNLKKNRGLHDAAGLATAASSPNQHLLLVTTSTLGQTGSLAVS